MFIEHRQLGLEPTLLVHPSVANVEVAYRVVAVHTNGRAADTRPVHMRGGYRAVRTGAVGDEELRVLIEAYSAAEGVTRNDSVSCCVKVQV